ncbi:MAG: hypothetical protein ACT443_06480, partial [Gemmatimonadota bacterium]
MSGMSALSALAQVEPAVVQQLEKLVTTQVVVAVALAIIALAVLAVAVGALLAVRKLTGTVDRTLALLTPKVDPILTSVSRISDDAEDVSSAVKHRVKNVLDTLDDLNGRLRAGADSVEERVKQFGAVVEVVQSEAEEILLDAASTARGVHTAS